MAKHEISLNKNEISESHLNNVEWVLLNFAFKALPDGKWRKRSRKDSWHARHGP